MQKYWSLTCVSYYLISQCTPPRGGALLSPEPSSFPLLPILPSKPQCCDSVPSRPRLLFKSLAWAPTAHCSGMTTLLEPGRQSSWEGEEAHSHWMFRTPQSCPSHPHGPSAMGRLECSKTSFPDFGDWTWSTVLRNLFLIHC